MAVIQLKRTLVGTVPTSLNSGEIMIDILNGYIYWEDTSNVIHRLNLFLGTMSLQNASAVAITGGTASGVAVTSSTINSTTVGATTPASGAFTTLSMSGNPTTPLQATPLRLVAPSLHQLFGGL